MVKTFIIELSRMNILLITARASHGQKPSHDGK